MLRKLLISLCLMLMMTSTAGFAEQLTVTVPETVRLRGPLMTLGEIASVSGDDPARIRALRSLVLGQAPAPGTSLALSRQIIGARLAGTGADLSDIAWNVPPMVSVSAESQEVSGQQLVAMAMSAIRDRSGIPADSDALTITELDSAQDTVVPAGDLSFTVELPYGVRYNTPTTVTISTMIDGRLYARTILKFDVRLYRQVVVAASNIAAGETVTAEVLKYERMDSGRLAPGYTTDINKFIGLVTRRGIASGMPVNVSMVQKPVLVKRGSVVTIIARIDGIEAAVYGQSMQDGCEGQVIRVQNINSRKTVAAKVIDAGTVEVVTHD